MKTSKSKIYAVRFIEPEPTLPHPWLTLVGGVLGLAAVVALAVYAAGMP